MFVRGVINYRMVARPFQGDYDPSSQIVTSGVVFMDRRSPIGGNIVARFATFGYFREAESRSQAEHPSRNSRDDPAGVLEFSPAA